MTKAMVRAMAEKNNRKTGAESEFHAVKYLREKNYSILKTNFRVGRLGEIDIIARNEEYICFIEVKSRRSNTFGTPGEAVTPSKQKKIRQLASIYLANSNYANNCIRFDVIEIILSEQGDTFEIKSINLIKNAF